MSKLAVHHATLANGLRVVVAPLPHLHQAHVGLWVRAGARFEDKATSGLSHFLEHAIHVGTRRFPDAQALSLAIERIGGHLDAGTGADDCIFPLLVPPKSLDEASAILAELVLRPTFGDVKAERHRVIEEIREGEDAEDERACSLVFKGHPLSLPILGSEERVRAFPLAQLRRWHRRIYTARNAVLVFAGAVDARAALRLARRDFGAMRSGKRIASEAPTIKRKRPRVHLDPVKGLEQTTLRFCFRSSDARAAVEVLERIIGEGEVSWLYRRLCDDLGLCYTAQSEFCDFEDAAYIQVKAASRDPLAVVREVLALLDELARVGPSAEELERVRRRIARDPIETVDDIEDAAEFYGREALYGRESSVEENAARLMAVSADEVRDAARELARPGRLTVLASGPRRKLARVRKLVRGWTGYSP